MADIQKRGSYTPRRVRERRAYQLVVTGGVAGAVGVVSLVLAVVGAHRLHAAGGLDHRRGDLRGDVPRDGRQR